MTQAAYIIDGVRTPIGRHGGALADIRPDDLAAATLRALVERSPNLDPEQVDSVSLGDANQAGEDNRNVARMALLLAGLPTCVPASTVNRLCASGMEALFSTSREIEVAEASIAIAGGVESMSRAPWVVEKPDRSYLRNDATMHSTTLGWRLINPEMPRTWTVPLAEGAEILADRYGISREQQDEFALRSHRNADRAWEQGAFAAEVTKRPTSRLERDEGIRPDTTKDALARLRPVVRSDGTVTAGNASQLSDGAAALLLADEAGAVAAARDPRARIAARATSAVEPHLYGIGPVEAANVALRRAGVGWGDLGVVELNEAFAAQCLACMAEWPDLDPAIVNPNGGAIALGHPLGCSGARLVLTLVGELERRGGGWGLAAMCIGVGQGSALVVEVPVGDV